MFYKKHTNKNDNKKFKKQFNNKEQNKKAYSQQDKYKQPKYDNNIYKDKIENTKTSIVLEPKKDSIKRGVIFFESFDEALKNINQIAQKKSYYDELSIVIEKEDNQNNDHYETLKQYGKVYTGAIWASIHKRRQEENWYT